MRIDRAGFTLVEMIIALGIFITAFVGLMATINLLMGTTERVVQNGRYVQKTDQAFQLVEEDLGRVLIRTNADRPLGLQIQNQGGQVLAFFCVPETTGESVDAMRFLHHIAYVWTGNVKRTFFRCDYELLNPTPVGVGGGAGDILGQMTLAYRYGSGWIHSQEMEEALQAASTNSLVQNVSGCRWIARDGKDQMSTNVWSGSSMPEMVRLELDISPDPARTNFVSTFSRTVLLP
jgi:type II secretory pathway pseudopilin PulG